MDISPALIIAAILLPLAAGLIYWQISVAEGAYLGQRVVTWLYDLTARRYDAIKQVDPDMEALFLGRPLAEVLGSRPAPLVLDIATGTGRLPLTLLERPAFQGHIIGVDHSRPMLVIAAQKLEPFAGRVTLIWRDAARLPFPRDTFDGVTCLEMLEFTPRPAAQIAEAIRVLRPGGVLLTTRRRGLSARLMPGKTHSREAFTALLKRHGIAHVEIQPWQVEYDLVWGVKAGHTPPGGLRTALDVLRCPACGEGVWQQNPAALACLRCGQTYPLADGIIEMAGRTA